MIKSEFGNDFNVRRSPGVYTYVMHIDDKSNLQMSKSWEDRGHGSCPVRVLLLLKILHRTGFKTNYIEYDLKPDSEIKYILQRFKTNYIEYDLVATYF